MMFYAMQETWVLFLGQEDPLGKEMATTPVLLPGESHGQRSLAGYSPWGHKSWRGLSTKPPPNGSPYNRIIGTLIRIST